MVQTEPKGVGARLAAELKSVSSADDFLSVRCRLLQDVVTEAARARALHGDDNPDGIRPDFADLADAVRAATTVRTEVGEQSWCDILAEEFMEVVVEVDLAKRRDELVKLAAAAIRWAETIDRRLGKKEPAHGGSSHGWWERAVEKLTEKALKPGRKNRQKNFFTYGAGSGILDADKEGGPSKAARTKSEQANENENWNRRVSPLDLYTG